MLGLLRERVDVVPVWLEPPAAQPLCESRDGGWRLVPPSGRTALPWLADRLAGLSVDAVHLHGVFESPRACLGLPHPLVVSFRGSDLSLGVFRHCETLGALLEQARVSTYMNETQLRLARRLFALRGPTLVVPNSLAELKVEPARLPLPEPIIGCVAEFRRVTGLDVLLRAFSALGQGTLLLVGPFHPLEASYYTRWIDRLPAVHRTGAVSPVRVRELMAGCDVLVFPSVSEGMPNKVLEAMSSGVPVVASDVAGNRQLIEDGVNGRLFGSRDDAHLLEVLREVLQEPASARESWARQARQRLAHEHSPEVELQGWLHCYRAAGLPV
jgi:glycosyltransferase involved in cell wall biosynthesis